MSKMKKTFRQRSLQKGSLFAFMSFALLLTLAVTTKAEVETYQRDSYTRLETSLYEIKSVEDIKTVLIQTNCTRSKKLEGDRLFSQTLPRKSCFASAWGLVLVNPRVKYSPTVGSKNRWRTLKENIFIETELLAPDVQAAGAFRDALLMAINGEVEEDSLVNASQLVTAGFHHDEDYILLTNGGYRRLSHYTGNDYDKENIRIGRVKLDIEFQQAPEAKVSEQLEMAFVAELGFLEQEQVRGSNRFNEANASRNGITKTMVLINGGAQPGDLAQFPRR